jgi:hypothetical protein
MDALVKVHVVVRSEQAFVCRLLLDIQLPVQFVIRLHNWRVGRRSDGTVAATNCSGVASDVAIGEEIALAHNLLAKRERGLIRRCAVGLEGGREELQQGGAGEVDALAGADCERLAAERRPKVGVKAVALVDAECAIRGVVVLSGRALVMSRKRCERGVKRIIIS